MRRIAMAVTALVLAAGLTPPLARDARADEVDCTDYCGKKAALRCDSVDSWECAWYIELRCSGACCQVRT